MSLSRVFVGDERPPAVPLTRVLPRVSGAHHGVRDLGAGVALGAARGPGQRGHWGLLQLIGLRSSEVCGPPTCHHSRLALVSRDIRVG